MGSKLKVGATIMSKPEDFKALQAAAEASAWISSRFNRGGVAAQNWKQKPRASTVAVYGKIRRYVETLHGRENAARPS